MTTPALTEQYVCDQCMNLVTTRQVHDFADGEHVLCQQCHRDNRERF